MPTENQPVKGKRDLFMERLQSTYPDKDFSDDEAVYGQILDDFDERDRRLKNYEDDENRLTQLFVKDGNTASFFSDLANGKSPITSLVERYGPLIRDAVDDPEKAKELEAATKVYLDRVAKNRELNEEYEKNLDNSFEEIDKAGISDEDFGRAMDKLQEMMNDFVVGKITPETIQLVLSGIDHDADVASADHIGEVRGKNAKFEESRRKPTGDGLPSIGSANNKQRRRSEGPDLGALGRFENYQDPFAGAKRTRLN